MKLLSSSIFSFLLLTSQLANANIQVNFYESAPKDRFVIKNTGQCTLQNITLEIDLSKSAGGLIFDTTAIGAGVEVFQPFEVTKGNIKLASKATVIDGDTKVALNIPKLPAGDTVSFTIDVDDTLAISELGKIRVSGSEIKNGIVNVNLENQKSASAKFGSNSEAIVFQPTCLKS